MVENKQTQFKEENAIPISFLVFPELIFSARHGVRKTPEYFAKKFNLFVEQSFECQLGSYVFVGFQKGEYYFGLRRLLDSPNKNYSSVSVKGAPEEQKIHLISQALDIHLSKIVEFEITE